MNIVEILDELEIPYQESGHHHCREGWVQIDCPLCSFGQEKWKCGLNLTYNYANCWQCGSMKLEYVLVNSISGLEQSHVKNLLKDIKVGSIITKEREGRLELPNRLLPLLNLHRRYLKERKFDPDELEKRWGLMALGQRNDNLAWSIFIPVHKYGNIVSWTTRAIDKSVSPRYMYARDSQSTLPAKSLLYGEDFARNTIIVVEGPFDVWRIGPGAVALFGTGFSNKQVERISRYPKRIICLDSELAAQRQAKKLAESLSPFPGETKIIELETGKDPDSASKKEIQELRSMLR